MPAETILSRIYVIRDQRVMLDHDLAALYGVETKVLNQAIKRNAEHFPEEFMFKLTVKEWIRSRPHLHADITQEVENEGDTNMRSQIVTAYSEVADSQLITSESVVKQRRNIGSTPYAFTEYGVAMAANFLRSERALQMSFAIVKTFIHLRKHSLDFALLAEQLNALEMRLGEHDVQLKGIYEALENLLDNKAEQEHQSSKKRRIGFKPDA